MTDAPAQTTPAQPGRSGEPRLAGAVSWLVLAASFGLSAATWIALAVLAGFDARWPVRQWGIELHQSWLMPVAIDGYVVVALVMWMAPVPASVAAFARINTYAAAGVGVVAQSCYHALITWSLNGVVWRSVLAAVVGALPPAVAGLAVHMRALVRRESARRSAEAAPVVAAVQPATSPTMPAPVVPTNAPTGLTNPTAVSLVGPVVGATSPTTIRPSTAPVGHRSAAASGPSKATIRAAVASTGHPTKDSDQSDHSDRAVTDAATIRAQYPDGLPDRGAQRMLRQPAPAGLKLHADRASKAIAAYRAGADLSDPGTPPGGPIRSGEPATRSGTATDPATP